MRRGAARLRTAGRLTLVALAALAGTVRAEILIPPCDWPFLVAPGANNVFYPDSIASYWVMPFTVQDGLRIEISGVYADARYASLNVYTDKPSSGSPFVANGVGSSLADYQFMPDPGSVNPWQEPAAPGGRFTVTLRQDAASGQPNTMPLSPVGTPEGNPGWVIYRIYLPAGGATGADYSDFSRIPLPRVRFHRGGESREVPACRATPASATPADVAVLARLGSAADAGGGADRGGSGVGAGPGGGATTARLDRADTLPGERWFYRPPNEESVGGFPNADSAYVGATGIVPPPERDVIVIRGKAPRQPPGLHPAPWPAPGRWDVRYWSMCTYTFFSLGPSGELRLTFPLVANRLPDGSVDYGCRHDDITPLDADGFYTYVVGTESQRARIERIAGATFLPFSADLPATPHSLYFRNMVPADGFEQGCQYVPYERNPDAAAAVMGPYYPRSRVCGLANLVQNGAVACLRDGGASCSFSAAERVVLGGRVRSVDADVLATGEGGRAQIGARARLGAGTLLAGAEVVLGGGSRVFDVDAAALERRRSAGVDGVVTSAAPPAVACTVPALACDPAAADVTVARGDADRTLPAGTHGVLRMASRSRLLLAPGRHVFCGLELGRAAVLSAQGAAGATIDVAGPMRIGRAARIGPATGAAPPRLRAGGTSPASVRIGAAAQVRAQVLAPGGGIVVGRGAQLVGGACARTFQAGRRADLRCTPAP
ncbi:MAG: hypothetical protein KIT14_02660 [bacterium]|nr:hypothetical protein [bacterium]